MNLPVIRLSEMYLIRGESRVMNGNEAGALADLNDLQIRAGLDEIETANREELLDHFFTQRSVELSMEGDNFHNLKRLKQPIGGLSWEEASYKLVFFLPEREVQLNPNLVQNELW